MPSFSATAIRYSLPDSFGSPGSSTLSDTPRLTSLSLSTSRTALARSSLFARMSTACSPDQLIDAPTPRKSKRVPISFTAWLSALSTSWRSSFDTMSKEDSLLATAPRLDALPTGRHAGALGPAPGRWARDFVEGRAVGGMLPGTHSVVGWAILLGAASTGGNGRLPEWPKGAVCKTVGSAYVGSNPTPATTCVNGP